MPDRGGDGSAKSTPAGMRDLDRGLARSLADAWDSGAHKLGCLEKSESPRRSLCRTRIAKRSMSVGLMPCFRMTKCAREPTSKLFEA
jgi:hypothetical protein